MVLHNYIITFILLSLFFYLFIKLWGTYIISALFIIFTILGQLLIVNYTAIY